MWDSPLGERSSATTDITYEQAIATIVIRVIFDDTNGFHDIRNIVAMPTALRAMIARTLRIQHFEPVSLEVR